MDTRCIVRWAAIFRWRAEAWRSAAIVYLQSAGPVGAFVAALLSEWATAMSGGLSVPFALAAFFFDSAARLLFATMALTMFWYAAYSVWRIEHDKVSLSATADQDRRRFVETAFAQLSPASIDLLWTIRTTGIPNGVNLDDLAPFLKRDFSTGFGGFKDELS